MAAPTVFRWSDTGAPTLNNTAGSLIGVLDYCLPQRGWVKEFSGTNKAVYRAGSGNRKYYRVLDDLSMVSSGFYSAKIIGYDSMTDVDTGAGWGQSAYIRASYNDASAKRWICIVDEKGFFIITQPHGGVDVDIALRVFVPHYIGETIPALSGQTSRDIIACCPAIGSANSAICSVELSNAATNIMCNRSLDGSTTNINIYSGRSALYTGAANGMYPVGGFTYCLYSYPHNGELLYCKNYLMDTATVNTIGDFIPWIYYTAQKGSGFTNGGAISADGKNFLTIYISGAVVGATLSTVVSASNSNCGVVLIAMNEER